jgi:glycosyltransferase involved in cell wall biosynthesis
MIADGPIASPPASASAAPRLAYLLSQYPAVSHTFFFHEIAAMRTRGFAIESASINNVAPPADGFSSAEMAECERTFYVKSGSKVGMLVRVVGIALRHPVVLLRGLREAFGLSPWDLYETLYALFYLAEALLVGQWMREKRCSHLHVHFSGPVATVALLTSVAWDVPYSLTVHGPDEFYNIEKFYLPRKIVRAKFISCISHFCRSQLLRIAPPAMWEKFHVRRLGVDETLFVPAPHEDSSATQLVSVGRLNPSKGQGILLLALARLVEQGTAFHLHLIGGGEERAHLEQMVAKHGLHEYVTFYGATSHSRTREILAKADIFVLSSFAEGVPVALMEAMAMEIVCVSTYVAGIPELIDPGTEGLLVAPSAVDELSEAIASLIADPVRRRQLAAAGRGKVLRSYNLARNADRLAELYRSQGLG